MQRKHLRITRSLHSRTPLGSPPHHKFLATSSASKSSEYSADDRADRACATTSPLSHQESRRGRFRFSSPNGILAGGFESSPQELRRNRSLEIGRWKSRCADLSRDAAEISNPNSGAGIVPRGRAWPRRCRRVPLTASAKSLCPAVRPQPLSLHVQPFPPSQT